MLWIKSESRLETHPKLKKLCLATGWNVNETIGKMHRFWWWVVEYAEDGDLSNFEPLEYLDDIKGDLSAPNLRKMLEEVGFIDSGTNLVHDWLDYAGNFLRAKYHQTDPKKYRRIVRKYKQKRGSSQGYS